MPYFLRYPKIILQLIGQHLWMVLVSLSISILIAVPLGWYLHRNPRLSKIVLGIFGIVYTIPSIALMIILIPFFGLNSKTVMISLILYSQIILLRNVISGLESIDPALMEAARGMGLSTWQIAWKVQLPLALPVILAGVRIATVVIVAIATIGAKFGAGGLGTLLFDGIAQAGRMDKIWTGAILVGLIAIGLNRLVILFENKVIVTVE
jgi:osmoprotectant transport system permease protein